MIACGGKEIGAECFNGYQIGTFGPEMCKYILYQVAGEVGCFQVFLNKPAEGIVIGVVKGTKRNLVTFCYGT